MNRNEYFKEATAINSRDKCLADFPNSFIVKTIYWEIEEYVQENNNKCTDSHPT